MDEQKNKTENIRKKYRESGSLTAEAALILPAILSAFLVFLFLLQILFVEQELQLAGIKAVRQTAACGYLLKYAEVRSDLLWEAQGEYPELTKGLTDLAQEAGAGVWFQAAVKEQLTAGRIVEQVVKGGWQGISFWGSEAYAEDEMTVLRMKYWVEFPVFGSLLAPIRFETCLMMRSFSGEGQIELGMADVSGEDGEVVIAQEGYVFVTEHGTVYHKNRNCVYLSRSVKKYPSSQLAQLRNKSGAKYYACKSCDDAAVGEQIWVTDYGTRYHTSSSCTQIERNVKQITLMEAEGYRACSRCGGGE